jgi:hypothetical protein
MLGFQSESFSSPRTLEQELHPPRQESHQLQQRSREPDEGTKKSLEQADEELKQAFEELKQRYEEAVSKMAEPGAQHPLFTDLIKITSQLHPLWSNIQGTDAIFPTANKSRSDRVESCPAKHSQQTAPNTELDLYEEFLRTSPAVRTVSPVQGVMNEIPIDQKLYAPPASCPYRPDAPTEPSSTTSNGWLSALGWDGRQQQEALYPDLARKFSDSSSHVDTINRMTCRLLDPFGNSHHTVPYLLVSPYSPIHLCNPDSPGVWQVKVKQGAGQPFQIIDTFYKPRGFIQFNHRREELARKLPWADAYEDLVCLEQTGKMVDRREPTQGTPAGWISDLAERGSLGPAWGFNSAGDFTKLSKENTEVKEGITNVERYSTLQSDVPPMVQQGSVEKGLPDAAAQRIFKPAESEVGSITADDVVSASIAASTGAAVQESAQSSLNPQPLLKEVESSKLLTPTATLPEVSESSWSSTTWSSSEQVSGRNDSILSTTTTTERWTRPDGTVETRRVFKKRFADGREIEEETHDFQEPRPSLAQLRKKAPWPVGPQETPLSEAKAADKQTQTLTPVQDELKNEKRRGGGWFWT